MRRIVVVMAAVAAAACSGAPEGDRDAGSTPGGVAAVDTAVAGPVATPGTEPIPGAEPDGGTAVAPAGSGPHAPVSARQPDGSGGAPAATAGAASGAEPVAPPASSAADDGAAVLRRAAAAYENVRSMRAEFVMNFENPLLRQRVTSRGTIYQRQPDRIALRFTEPDGDLIVGDGQYFWVYYPSNNAQQVIRSPAAAAGESAVNLQAQFVGNPVERFNYTVEGRESVGSRDAHVLLLAPRQRAEYRSLKVWVDARDNLVRRFEITEHNGSVRRFDLQNLQVNPSIPDSVFRFTPPDGVRVVSPG